MNTAPLPEAVRGLLAGQATRPTRRQMHEIATAICEAYGWDSGAVLDITIHADGTATATLHRGSRPKDTSCMDCDRPDPEYYSVRTLLWQQAVEFLDKDRFLCLACLEERLGRALVDDDFMLRP